MKKTAKPPHERPLKPIHRFLKRFYLNLMIGVLIIISSLVLGVVGYHYYEGMPWIDAYVNAAMILSGMGPLVPLNTDHGKLFAGSYALFCGIVFLIAMAVIFGPIFHRFMHKFHLDED